MTDNTLMYRVAETAHKSEKRKTFHEMLDYARRKKNGVDDLLFYKVDRAARNMKDWIDLVDLRDKHGIEIVCITEPFDETPAGKLNSNMLAAISQFYSDQLSIRTAEGVERRVRTDLFSGWAPYGYENYRENGRGLVRLNADEANNVKRIFELYAYHQHSLDKLVVTLRNEGRLYSGKHPDFVRSKLYGILTDRSYIGEIKFRGQWVEGKHEHIIDIATFDRVQVLLGNKSHHRHRSVYGNGLIICGHCGRPVLCEVKFKRSREYHYYHCTNYTKGDHPRERTTGIELDRQMLALFDKLRIEDKKVLQWLQRVIRARAKAEVKDNTAQLREITRQQLDQNNKDRDILLTLRMHGEIEADTFARKDGELRNLSKRLKLRLDGQERIILEIVCLNLTLKNASLEISMRKPFDTIAEGLVLKNGAGGLPSLLHIIQLNHFILNDKGQVFHFGLGNKHAVKRIPVAPWQTFSLHGVFRGHGQKGCHWGSLPPSQSYSSYIPLCAIWGENQEAVCLILSKLRCSISCRHPPGNHSPFEVSTTYFV